VNWKAILIPYLSALGTFVIYFLAEFHSDRVLTFGGEIRKGYLIQHSAVLVFLFVAATIGASYQQSKTQQEANSGLLELKNTVLFSPAENKYPTVKLGFSEAKIVFQIPVYQQFWPWFQDSRLQIAITDGRLSVSSKIYNEHGDLVAELVNNEWAVQRPPAWDRNYTRDALEVKDNKGNIVLQVKLEREFIQLQAILFGADGGNAVMIGSRAEKGEMRGQVYKATQEHPIFEIQPMFKYPSSRHFGELIKKQILPDGRKKVGVVVFGKPDRFQAEASKALLAFEKDSFFQAIIHSQRALASYEKAEKKLTNIPPDHVGGVIDKKIIEDLEQLLELAQAKLKSENRLLFEVSKLIQ